MQEGKILGMLFFPTQVVCRWQWKVPRRLRSLVRTTKMAPALCPTCPQLQETTTSLSSLTISTFLAVPLLLRSLVRNKLFVPQTDFFILFYTDEVYMYSGWLYYKSGYSGWRMSKTPFSCEGDDSITRTSQLNVGTAADVSLKIAETDLSSLSASIRAPSGNEEPCLLKKLPNRHLGETSARQISQ